jgi:hypothetical protein
VGAACALLNTADGVRAPRAQIGRRAMDRVHKSRRDRAAATRIEWRPDRATWLEVQWRPAMERGV